MRYLKEQLELVGDILDYGCGRGNDAVLLHLDHYDPHYFPDQPERLYDVITCIYVLNVLDDKDYASVISSMRKLLKPKGVMFVVVRRDVTDGYTKKGTYQHNVYLEEEIFHEVPHYCMYRIKKGA